MHFYSVKHLTKGSKRISAASAETYETLDIAFHTAHREIKDLSNKKPDATLTKSNVSIINNLLTDALTFLKNEPEGKYLVLLEDQNLPQNRDAILIMSQYEAALEAFRSRYYDSHSGWKLKNNTKSNN